MSNKMKLKDVGTIITGNTPSKKCEEYYDSNDINFFTPTDFDDGRINDFKKSVNYISEKARKKARVLPKGSVLVTCIGIIGKVGILENESAFNQQINAIIPNTKIIDNRYLAYWLISIAKVLREKANAPVVPIMNKTDFQEIEIDVPDIDTQKIIVKKLDRIQKMLDIKIEQKKLLEKVIKAKIVELFGDPLLNPKNWNVKKLKEISNKIMSGNTPKGGSQVYVDSGITFFRSQNVWRNKLELDDIAYIDEETHKKMIRSSLKHNDLLITKTGRINTENSSLGRTALYDGPDDKANVNGHVYLVRLNNGENHKYVLRILISEEYKKYIRSVCVGGIDKRQLNKEQIEEFPIIYPPKELQKQFSDLVEKIEEQENKIDKEIDIIIEMKDNLMNKYFN